MERTIQKRNVKMTLVAKTPIHDIITNHNNIIKNDGYNCIVTFVYNDNYFSQPLINISEEDYASLKVEYEYNVSIYCVFIEPNKSPRIIIDSIEPLLGR